MATADILRSFLQAAGTDVPRAPGFIVSLYGDVVEPRGGTLWMGDLVRCCAQQSISESLVRTAVSRLVAAGKLLGERIGRKSYYRLTEAAQAEFREASEVLYAPPPRAQGWLVALKVREPLPVGWALLANGTAIAPNRSDIVHLPGPLLSCEALGDLDDWPGLSEGLWDMRLVADRYRVFLKRFGNLEEKLEPGTLTDDRSGAMALSLRLQLIHHYRLAALRDPRLPREAWPEDWPAELARRLFVRSYLALAPRADECVGKSFRDAIGFLPSATSATEFRLDRLMREAAALKP